MFDKRTRQGAHAHFRYRPISKTGVACALRRAQNAATGAVVAILLAACSGSLPFLPGAPLGGAEQQGAAPASEHTVPARPKHARATTARDILAEWGTFGLGPKSLKRNRAPKVPHAYDTQPLPDYTLSIEQIMANASCHACEDRPYHQLVLNAASRHGVPASLIHAVIQKESGYNPGATSKRRARGLMQITPETARFVGVRDSRSLYDPQTNINAGTAYLKYLMLNHDSFDEVLAAYNSGPGNVRKYNGVPPFSETVRYVRDVKNFYAITSTEQQ